MFKIKDLKNKFKNHFKSFVKEEDGFEFLQLVVVIAITAVLGGIIWKISNSAQEKLTQAQDMLDKDLDLSHAYQSAAPTA